MQCCSFWGYPIAVGHIGFLNMVTGCTCNSALVVVLCCWSQVTVHGNMSVSFFDAEAGWSPVGPVTLAARMEPSVSDTHNQYARWRRQLLFPPCIDSYEVATSCAQLASKAADTFLQWLCE